MAQADYRSTHPMPLSFACIGEVVYIQEIQAGRKLRRRLTEMGLLRGVCVRVMQRGMGGPVIIAINQDSRLALGACMSQKIIVTRQPEHEQTPIDYTLDDDEFMQLTLV